MQAFRVRIVISKVALLDQKTLAQRDVLYIRAETDNASDGNVSG